MSDIVTEIFLNVQDRDCYTEITQRFEVNREEHASERAEFWTVLNLIEVYR